MRRSDWYRRLLGAHGRLGRRLFHDGHALPPVQLFFEATARCDQSCRFCFYRGVLGRPEDTTAHELPTSAILDIVHRLPSARLVSFSGGEPLLRHDLIEILGRVGRDRGVSLETNGGRVDPETARALVVLAASTLVGPGLIGVDVSLHGRRSTHDWLTRRSGSFDRSTAGLMRLVEERERRGSRFPLLTIKLVLTASNLEDLPWMLDFARQRGVDHLGVKLLDPGRTAMSLQDRNSPLRGTAQVRTELDSERVREVLGATLARRRIGPEVFLIPLSATVDDAVAHYTSGLDLGARDCLSPWSRLSVLPGGEFYLCKLFGAGSADRMTPLQAWNSAPYRAFRRQLLDGGLPAECVGCCYLE